PPFLPDFPAVETLRRKCNGMLLTQIRFFFLLVTYYFPLSSKNCLMTSANIFPDVFGATTPGKLRARIALIPRCLAKSKSVPPGLEARSKIIPCGGSCPIDSLLITGAGTVLINKSHCFVYSG